MSGDIIAVILLWISPGCRCVEAVISAAIMLVIVNVSDHNSCSGLDLLWSDLMFACGEQLSQLSSGNISLSDADCWYLFEGI